MQDILNELMKSEFFNVAIIDKDNHLLTNNLGEYKGGVKEWTKYLDTSKDIRFKKHLNEDNFSSYLTA